MNKTTYTATTDSITSTWSRAADVRLDGCEITDNGAGILAEESSNLEIIGCDICDNYESGGGFAGGLGCTGALEIAVGATRFITASGLISPDLEPGDCCIHLYTTNDLQNDPSNSTT